MSTTGPGSELDDEEELGDDDAPYCEGTRRVARAYEEACPTSKVQDAGSAVCELATGVRRVSNVEDRVDREGCSVIMWRRRLDELV